MQKEKLILFSMCIGAVIMLCSWYLSYPLSIDSPYDFIFNHISPVYWLGLPLFLASLYVTATRLKNSNLKFVICLGILMSMYSLDYFYYSLPGADMQQFRGQTEYFMASGDLDPSKPNQMYFQWPLYFIYNEIVHSIVGLELIHFEFLLYAILGFLYVASFYVYASKFSKDGSHIVMVVYFIIMYWFFHYEFVPFSIAMGLLFLLFMLETHTPRKRETTLTTMMIFTSITFLHPFAPTFFIIYTLVMYILSGNKRYLRLFLLTLVIYLAVSIYFAGTFFPFIIKELTDLTSQYTVLFSRTFSESVAPTPFIGAIAQIFSRVIVISTAAIAGLGFLFLLIKRKLRRVDHALFISGALYAGVGFIFPVLPWRGFFLLFIPISLGVIYFLRSKFGKYYKCLFLVFLVLFAFIPLHQSFADGEIMFQTREAYQSANFMIDYYDWAEQSSILSHFRLMRYLQMRSASSAYFGDDIYTANFPENITNYDCIVYTVGLGKSFLFYNYSAREIFYEGKYNVVFNSGFSSIAIKANSSYSK